MKKTDTQLAHEAVGLMECIEDKFSLLDHLNNVDIPALIEDSKRRVAEIFAHLNSVYNPSSLPLKSVIELAEEYHRMTQEEFTEICNYWITNLGYPKVIYDGKVKEVRNTNELEGLLYLSEGIGWQNFDSCKLIK